MTGQEDVSNLGKFVCDDNKQNRKSWTLSWQSCSRYLIAFLSKFCFILLIVFCCFWSSHFSITCDKSIVWVGFLCAAVYFYKKSRLYNVDWSMRDGQVTTCLQLAQKRNVTTKNWQILLFYQHSQPPCDDMQKKIENLEFVQCENFDFTDSLKNNGLTFF